MSIRKQTISRRRFVATSALAMSAAPFLSPFASAKEGGTKMKLGLVTYLWGQHWDLPTLIANCEKAQVLGVETRTQHAHGVEPELNAKQRKEVKQRFADSPVVHVGPGTNQSYDSPVSAVLKKSIERTKELIRLSADTGGSGVKVKPNSFHKNVPHEQTIEQIGRSLDEVGKFASDHGQEIRLEVHGSCSELPTIHAIMNFVEQKSVGVCWNCNSQDLNGKGLGHNFALVRDRFGATCHVRELNVGDYPYEQLMSLLVKSDYEGWVLLECRTKIKDGVKAMIEQRHVFHDMIAKARA